SDRITPITVGFMQCKYRFHGIKLSGEQYTSDWRKVTKDDCYQVFKPDKQVHWRRLVIESAGSFTPWVAVTNFIQSALSNGMGPVPTVDTTGTSSAAMKW
ncbi:hypothetical protein BGZ89_003477, partial [Linnemannia elongata]